MPLASACLPANCSYDALRIQKEDDVRPQADISHLSISLLHFFSSLVETTDTAAKHMTVHHDDEMLLFAFTSGTLARAVVATCFVPTSDVSLRGQMMRGGPSIPLGTIAPGFE